MKDVPLFVDLDGTYTKTDLLFESFLVAFKANPFIIFNCISWLIKGKATLKSKLSEHAEINTSTLPLNQEFISYLVEEKRKGRKLYLATASNEKYAKEIVKNTDIFDGYISSCDAINLKGKAKLLRIKEISEKFSYAGNDLVDFEIFEEASESLLVNPTKKAKKRAKKIPINRVFDEHKSNTKVWAKQLRVHQWLKNLLVFVPVVVSGGFTDFNNVITIISAFLAFSFLASSTYILNDLLDLESDRVHKRKKNRPLAAGTISIKNGVFASLFLLSTSVLIATYLGYNFSLVLIAYLFLTLFYSFKIKQYIGMDVVALALLYTIRILAGAAAINVIVSFWLFAFSIFVFLSLALVKRCSEIQSMEAEGKQRANGRDYEINDYAVLESFGTSSAMLAVLMFCFYINNNVLTNQYQQPNILWLIVPALCYWLMRMWIKTHRGEMHDDPIVFSLKDKGSLVTIGFCGLIAIAAQIL
ncbi:UbiA family prenyltransferase [Bowmanella sp. Y57]|uniref:UbiA family prenyltransferase n=2 Tax=Bowmanella yangjiangensis TaxID=2811230 RepID=A0ABS3CS26_9ALTE|nr:UbiA family prenyltransferase [Bowmanella yangjiangensis]